MEEKCWSRKSHTTKKSYLIIINSCYSISNQVLQLFDTSAKSPQFKAIQAYKRVAPSDKN